MFWIALLGLAFAVLLYVRVAPSTPARWHADPLAAGGRRRTNEARALPPSAGAADIESPVLDMNATALARRLDEIALAEPRTRRLAGGPETGHSTYLQRSAVFGFPDYVSVKAVPAGENRSAPAIWSRSRFGHADMGVNRARVERWLAALG